ncbi:MAG: tRNA lysidine(34) synthetase TilS [Mogibacterium sp.]|nr:tRNA lysidine(34) synthetase TilS [Mogibacterium sp.]
MKKNYIIDNIIDNGLIAPGSAVIIGVSGGPDSLCLLHALNSIADMYDLLLVPVHVNHMLRPEAYAESDHLADICDRMDLELRVYEASCRDLAEELGISTEEAGREVRYQIFDEVAAELEDDGVPSDKIVIAVAHNADDQAETVLFRLIRGTGPHGLAGIPAVRISEAGYLIVRPLLNIERKDIEAYIKENKLRPNIDKSNSENTYTRNKIRNELIPYLEKNYNPKIKDNLRRYAGLAYMDDTLLRDLALTDYLDCLDVDSTKEEAVLDISKLKNNPPSINSRIVSMVFDLLRLEACATYENVTAIVSLIYGDHPSAGIDLPYGIRARREYDHIVFSASEEVILPDDSIAIYPQVVMAKDFVPDEDSPYAAFDFDSFNEEYPGRLGDIELRTRREGDYLPMKKGNKKIQDLLVDSKVRKAARDSILMVCIDSEVLWVLPNEYFSGEREKTKGRFSPKFHINDTTKRVLLIELDESI